MCRNRETTALPRPELMMDPLASSSVYLTPSTEYNNDDQVNNTYENELTDETYESLQDDRSPAANSDYEHLHEDDGDFSDVEADVRPDPPLPRPELPAPHWHCRAFTFLLTRVHVRSFNRFSYLITNNKLKECSLASQRFPTTLTLRVKVEVRYVNLEMHCHLKPWQYALSHNCIV